MAAQDPALPTMRPGAGPGQGIRAKDGSSMGMTKRSACAKGASSGDETAAVSSIQR